ncbi:hypothetical protein FSP39_015451 [Pinctada imbricata]|uniref:FYVE-type domain-containing protein n=1 Tax=Pinctada imbricata TaxID=66713 RepID=A0AA88XML9_PINIB|nr:hypothetical protein FSP39_015451 [Pinctada imbricata]
MKTEYETYKQTVDKVSEEARKVIPSPGQQLLDTGATCQICHKTKFADGVGHTCHYCQLKSCARCGGRLQLKQNKSVWACNLCRKKQDLLAKTGAWYHGGMAKPVQLDVVETPSGSETTSTKTDISPPTEKRPKINGKHSDGGHNSEKENLGHKDRRQMSRGMSMQGKELKRQFSLDAHTKGSKERINTPELSEHDKLRERGQIPDNQRAWTRHARFGYSTLVCDPQSKQCKMAKKYENDYVQKCTKKDVAEWVGYDATGPTDERGVHDRRTPDTADKHSKDSDHRPSSHNATSTDYAEKDTMKSSRETHNVDNDKRRIWGNSQNAHDDAQHSGKLDRSNLRHTHVRDRLGSTNKERSSPTLSDRSERRIGEPYSSPSPNLSRRHGDRTGVSPSLAEDAGPQSREHVPTGQYVPSRTSHHLDPSTAASGRNSRNNRNRKMENMSRNDSLSSDPSDCARPPPPKPHKHRRGGSSKRQTRQHSLSSSDDEIRSTPECSSCEEQDNESESLISEKGKA